MYWFYLSVLVVGICCAALSEAFTYNQARGFHGGKPGSVHTSKEAQTRKAQRGFRGTDAALQLLNYKKYDDDDLNFRINVNAKLPGSKYGPKDNYGNKFNMNTKAKFGAAPYGGPFASFQQSFGFGGRGDEYPRRGYGDDYFKPPYKGRDYRREDDDEYYFKRPSYGSYPRESSYDRREPYGYERDGGYYGNDDGYDRRYPDKYARPDYKSRYNRYEDKYADEPYERDNEYSPKSYRGYDGNYDDGDDGYDKYKGEREYGDDKYARYEDEGYGADYNGYKKRKEPYSNERTYNVKPPTYYKPTYTEKPKADVQQTSIDNSDTNQQQVSVKANVNDPTFNAEIKMSSEVKLSETPSVNP